MENEELGINKEIGSRIVAFRKAKKMTRSKLARILFITQQQLAKYENGINRISAAKLAILSKYFEMDILYFYNNLLIDKKLNKDNLDILFSNYLNIKDDKNKELINDLVKILSKL